ncbi:cytochrome P450 [Hypoxylon sp. FL1150]|nr:cytochrome P450 [Hypoxylon sp. FL1150]
MELPFIVGGIFAVFLLKSLIKRLLYPQPLPESRDLPSIASTYKKLTEFSFPIARRSLKFGSPIFQLFMNPFSKPYVMIDDPREVTDLLLRRNKEFDKSIAGGVWQTFLPYSTIAQRTTHEWKTQRKTWQDSMNPDFLRRVVAKHIYAAATDLTKLWEVRNLKSNGLPVDVSSDFSYAALDAIWTATFGEQLDLAKAQMEMVETGKKIQTKGLDMHSTVQYINELANAWRGALWPAWTRWRMLRNPNYIKYMEVKDREIDRILLDASARFQRLLDGTSDGEEHDTCAMDLILRRSMLAAQKSGKPVPDPTKDQRMRDELLLFIYAGHDTTSTTLQWFVKFMTNNPEAQVKLRNALKAVFPGDSLPEVGDIINTDVPYLNATIEETLRCAGTAGRTTRTTRTSTTDTELFGHKIPIGTEIALITTTQWHPPQVSEDLRSPSSRAAFQKSGGLNWTSAPAAQNLDQFAPERWFKYDEEGNEVFDSGALFQNAFGGGTRGCFGRHLAMMELRIMITLIIMRFKMRPVPLELNSFQVTEKLLRTPRQCFLKLEAA